MTPTKQQTESPTYQSCEWVIFIIDGLFINYKPIHLNGISFITINIGTYRGRSILSNTNKSLNSATHRICLRRPTDDPIPSPTARPTRSPTTDVPTEAPTSDTFNEENATCGEEPQTQIQLQLLNEMHEKQYITPCAFKSRSLLSANITPVKDINIITININAQVSGLSSPTDNEYGQASQPLYNYHILQSHPKLLGILHNSICEYAYKIILSILILIAASYTRRLANILASSYEYAVHQIYHQVATTTCKE